MKNSIIEIPYGWNGPAYQTTSRYKSVFLIPFHEKKFFGQIDRATFRIDFVEFTVEVFEKIVNPLDGTSRQYSCQKKIFGS